ncbi:MAG: class I SAM-dependent methyltransferase family protein [Euryarchaeota archaeon]|nr:class I SAM-dependent methyltransferase family protein [Euryarchaeota archaeon]
MRCLKVPKPKGEEVRYALGRQRLVRKDRKIIDEGEFIFIPVLDSFTSEHALASAYEMVDMEPPGRTVFREPLPAIKKKLQLPDELEELLPYKWEHLGDVVIIRLPKELEHEAGRIGEAYAKELNAKAVLNEVGVITGTHRRPDVHLIFGDDTETVHREGPILYKLDPRKVMFSSGNIKEKNRMAALDCRGETVVDMFAGIGYFTLPIAKKARASKVIACEINPDSYHYLVENIELNELEDVVEPFLGDNMDLPGERFADRVIMGYFGTTEKFLPKALSLIRPGGIVHYHDVAGIEDCPGKLLRAIDNACEGRKYEVVGIQEAKSFAPCKSHIVVDFKVLD